MSRNSGAAESEKYASVTSDEYKEFLSRVDARFTGNVDNGANPVFTTDASRLWDAYLAALPVEVRDENNCHACKDFVARYGALVTIDTAGNSESAIWNVEDAPSGYRDSVLALRKFVQRASVTGVFLSSDAAWGKPKTGEWQHLAVRPPLNLVYKPTLINAFQAIAEKKEDFQTVELALSAYPLPVIEKALTLLRTESLYRSEKVLGQAEWLRDLHLARNEAHGKSKSNLLWLAVAKAPAGFCHPRSSMIGTLLDDIAAGLDFAEVSRKFAAKMNPLRYQRPQVDPSAGTIADAERIFAQLGLARSLERRFAREDELEALWRPTVAETKKTSPGIFAHLKPKTAATSPSALRVPAQTMTWEKFQRTVLPTAERIEFLAVNKPSNYVGIVTAVHVDAPPILQWDIVDARNPVSWYVWVKGSLPSSFCLEGDKYHDISTITLKPSMWGASGAKFSHQGEAAIFILAGARETQRAGLMLFPETLKSDLYRVRSVIEAYSKSGRLEGMEEPHACGIMLQKGVSWDAKFRVTTEGSTIEYQLDRWD